MGSLSKFMIAKRKTQNFIRRWKRLTILNRFKNGTYSFETIDVCLCGGEQFEQVADQDRFGIPVFIKRCNNCGLGIQSPRPTAEALVQFYQEDYRKLYRTLYRGTVKIGQEYFFRSYRRGKRILEYLLETGVDTEKKTVVEVGCGPGGILKAFQEKDNQVWGCELDKQCVDYSNAQNIPTLFGSLDVLKDAEIQADIIILSHLLEHIPDPVEFMKSMRGILKKNGVVYIEVPGTKNPDSDFHEGIQIAHLYYFDLATLEYLMGKVGFQMITGDEIVNSVFKKR